MSDFNLCFHHFDDPAAETVLKSAIQSADAFVYILHPAMRLTTALIAAQDLRVDQSDAISVPQHGFHRPFPLSDNADVVPTLSAASVLHLRLPSRADVLRGGRVRELYSGSHA